ncbi:hypothetical protein RJZ56_000869 [Blastomyces dermatitidis]
MAKEQTAHAPTAQGPSQPFFFVNDTESTKAKRSYLMKCYNQKKRKKEIEAQYSDPSRYLGWRKISDESMSRKLNTISDCEGRSDEGLAASLAGQDETSRDNQSHRHSTVVSGSRGIIPEKQSMKSPRKQRRRHSLKTGSNIKESSLPMDDATDVTSSSHASAGDIDASHGPLEPPLHILPNSPGAVGLENDIHFFLTYRRESVTFRHYFMKVCAGTFFRDEIITHTLAYEPLMCAVVSFAAYHYSLLHPNCESYTFFEYYNRSISGLLKSLQSGEQHTDAMLLTILQLAAIEEYLGNWVYVVNHHQAARRVLLELYSPETLIQDHFHRHIFMWYSRFDVMVRRSGNETILGCEWYLTTEKCAVDEAAMFPDDLGRQIWALTARNRRYAMDMASLYTKTQQGLITTDEFMTENQKLLATLHDLQHALKSIQHPEYLIMSYPHRKPPEPDDIVDPYVPGVLYGEPLWELNSCAVDIMGSKLMHKYQTGLVLRKIDRLELRDVALELCQVMETMERLPGRPREVALLFQDTLTLVALSLPCDEKHMMWAQRKLATIEQLGYIYPPAFRIRMANLWKNPELTNWWLPKYEGYPNFVREIREWMKERTDFSKA